MRIYKDIITGDELFTDTNKINLIDDCLYEVFCSHITRKQGEIVLAGANPSAEGEDADGGTDETVESGLDLVLNQQLQSTSFDKDSYMTYLKTYAKSLKEKWAELEYSPEQIEEDQKKFMQAVKLIRPKLKEAEFYMGESCNVDGMVAVLEYRDKPDGSGEQAIMLFFKQGVQDEKV